MEGVLDAALRVCVCKLMSSVLLCPSVVTHTITAVSLCCCCLLLFTDLAVTLFLLYVWLMEFWLTPFSVSSDVVALRFLLFLCQAYGVVLLLTPLLIAVELLVNLLRRPQDGTTTGHLEQNASESKRVSRTIGCFGCLLAWIVSGIYSSHDWTLERFSVEACLKRGGRLVTCIPDMDEVSWVLPAMVVLLSLTGSLGRLKSRSPSVSYRNTQMGEKKDYGVLGQMHMSLSLVDSTTPNSCGVHRDGCVYSEQRWSCPGNDVLCAHQTGLADNYSQKQNLSTFAQSKTDLRPEVTSLAVFNRSQGERCCFPERESPRLRQETLTGLVCMALVCVFPTVVSGNILLIFNLENLVVNTFKLLSHSVNRLP
ncbi:uncharacterized protein LOC130088512 [Rhinichthys klamathensis goyatoka]|uniref:uncharacterized protein LOC130088512 n=1 Tax=Rhinichthys klamathensis goyatoka TaxID=3034132 RepID=UPI0024B584DF|nr:uncharacterized protein LOC130088512 [Rhinichthys klamathensis goyatoka]